LYIQKASGDSAGKTAHEKPIKNIQGKNSVPAQVQSGKTQAVHSKSPAANSTARSAANSAASLISSAKLPADKLSTSIVLFARFFSLPMKPEVLTAIRSQALAPQNAAATQTETAKSAITQSELLKQRAAGNADSSVLTEKNRLVFSFTAAAAESKGVELDAKGLELYANAIDPDMERRRDSNSHNKQQNKNQKEKDDDGENYKSCSINVNTLKEIALEAAEGNQLLYLLNRLPGRDDQRWIVFPFDINENGRDYRVSLRILPETLNRVSLMTLDIVEIGDLEKRSTFTLEAADSSINTLNIYMKPKPSLKAKYQLESALSGLLNIPVERVSVKENNDFFPMEYGGEEELFRSVDEAV